MAHQPEPTRPMLMTRALEQHLTERLKIMLAVGTALITIAGCAGRESPSSAADSTTAATSAASASTRPSSGQKNSAQEAADIHSIATYPLTETHVNQTLQVMKTVHSMEKSDPSLAAIWNNQDDAADNESMDAAVHRITKMPKSAEIFGQAGISPHDFVYTMFALMYAGMAYQLKQAGQPVTTGKMAAEVNPANMDFVATHPQVLKELSAIDSTENSNSQ